MNRKGIDEIIEKLKLEEKAALLQGWSTWTTRGVNRLAIPSMFLSDGPHGLRKQAEMRLCRRASRLAGPVHPANAGPLGFAGHKAGASAFHTQDT